ncbi:glycosyltransferase [Paenochrobactrum pullorum]|uniref:glycosyltransferase n=1 Tax=Paenochrobactrum pullorum TaxID=1324351 RepID=UPI0035BC8A41
MYEMKDQIRLSIVVPVFNEQEMIVHALEALYHQYDDRALVDRDLYELVTVDNNSTDNSVAEIQDFHVRHPDFNLYCISETIQGVSSARKRGMDWVIQRSRQRDQHTLGSDKFYILSADADCVVDKQWLYKLYSKMIEDDADLGTCNYYYDKNHFHSRPNLWQQIEKTLRCRAFAFTLFGGFPDGKGFAVEREKYETVGGIEIFYQIKNGCFVQHLSDDWDFGIKIVASGGNNTYAHHAKVQINSRRVDLLLNEVIHGIAYGSGGTIVMKDVRTISDNNLQDDLSDEQAALAWDYSIKDFIPKNIILPLLLNQKLYNNENVIDFFDIDLLSNIVNRIEEIKAETGILNFKPIHLYKTPSYRLYFEFRDEIFARLRQYIGKDIGYPPKLPDCLDDVLRSHPDAFNKYVYYYCEDRESGNAHNYFANGGVF